MKHSVILFAVVVAFTLSAFGQKSVEQLKVQAKSIKAEKEVRITYDKFKDEIGITTKPYDLIGSWEGGMSIVANDMAQGSGGSKSQSVLLVNAFVVVHGASLVTTPEKIALIFTSGSGDWNFLKGDRSLYLILDGTRKELKPVGRDSDVGRMAGSVMVTELLGFELAPAELAEIANAKVVEMRLGSTKPRTWKPELLARMRKFLEIIKV